MRLKRLKEPKPNKISFRTIIPSRKTGEDLIIDYPEDHMITDSRKGESILEMRLHVLLEYEKRVSAYEYQAVPESKDGQFRKLEYYTQNNVLEEWVPDASVIWTHLDPWIIEVKTIKELANDLKKLQNKFRQTSERVKEQGFFFYVFTDAHLLDSFRVDNLLDLESQIGYQTAECINAVLRCFDLKNTWTTAELQENLDEFSNNEVLASICFLIYDCQLFIDLDEEFTHHTPIAKDSSLDVPLDKWFERYNWEKDCRKLLDEESLVVVDKTQYSEIEHECYEKRKQIVLDKKQGLTEYQISLNHGVSVSWIHKLWKRSKQGRDLDALWRTPGSGRPKQILFDIDEDHKPVFPDPEFEKVIAFYENSVRPNPTQCWKKYLYHKRILAYELGFVDDTSTAYRKLKNALKKHDLDVVRKKVFLHELDRYTSEYKQRVLMKREGAKAGLKAIRNITGTTPMMNYIGQMGQIDHSAGDVLPIVPFTIYQEQSELKSRYKVKAHYMERPSITVVLDIHTRVVLGYAFRYRKPSRGTTFMALRRTVLGKVNPLLKESEQRKVSTAEKILKGFRSMLPMKLITESTLRKIEYEFDPARDKAGLRYVADWWDSIRVMPRLLHTDNGSDFTSKDVEDWTRDYGIKLSFRPVGGANYGGHVERVLRTLNEQGFHILPGTTKGSTDRRGDYPSEKEAVYTFEQLEAIFLLITLKYHVTPHNTIGIPPVEAWYRAVSQGHNLLPFELSDEKTIREFAYNTLPRKIPSYIENKGIKINDIIYNYEKQVKNDKSWTDIYKKGSKIDIRYDTSDVRFVWWKNPVFNRSVRAWASKIRINNREYGMNKLRRLPPLSLLQYKDLKAANRLPIDKSEFYEELENRADNVYFAMFDNGTKSKKERQKALKARARKAEVERVVRLELEETAKYLDDGSAREYFLIEGEKTTANMLDINDEKLDGLVDPFASYQPEVELVELEEGEETEKDPFGDLEILLDDISIKKSPTRRDKVKRS
ncbi:MAG: hypothetical protein ACFFD4_28440 [Candidatus Odinarchaeota archaeon]